MALRFYNTLTKRVELFRPMKKGRVSIYTCGPTVYQSPHLGNIRTYLFADVLKRVFLLAGYRVKHIVNITDVGHLVSDADIGDDKVERAARKEHMSARQIARLYEQVFYRDLKRFNIFPADAYPRATENIKEQIALVKTLERKGYTYKTRDGIYFDTKKFRAYGALAKRNIRGIKAGARVKQGEKKSPTDFALWKFSPSRMSVYKKRQMEWNSPWGVGFPGWHLECSAMSMKYLGKSFDIHIGGIDHIQVHHTNEIAQSEASSGKRFVRYWLHPNFLTVKGAKTGRMGKSEGNAITADELIKRGFDALDFRYFALTAHWRNPLEFSWEALSAARHSRRTLTEYFFRAEKGKSAGLAFDASSGIIRGRRVAGNYGKRPQYARRFQEILEDNIHTPRALAYIWELVDQKKATRELLLWADHAFGLSLLKESRKLGRIPQEVRALAEKREAYRRKKNWGRADQAREKLAKMGWGVDDTPNGPIIHRI